jgi:hypothetical protein
MKIRYLGKLVLPAFSAALVFLGTAQFASGEVISTENAFRLDERSAAIDRVSTILAQQHFSNQLIALGVDPVDAQQRVASLSDGELQLLDQKLAEMPAGAGGALEVLGIVLLVLLVLELLGVTDIFKSI